MTDLLQPPTTRCGLVQPDGRFPSGRQHPNWKNSLGQGMLGRRFGSWTLTSLEIQRRGRRHYWSVRCDCGREQWVLSENLTRGLSSHCRWCSNKKGAHFKVLGGRYDAIVARCRNVSNPAYKHYGGRGVECRFSSRAEFVLWVEENLPHKDYVGVEIDRVDNNGHYAPGNLRLASRREQMSNTRSNNTVEYCGTPVCVTHMWHLLKTDYPSMNLGPGRTAKRLLNGQPWQEIVALPERRSGGRKSTTSPMPDPAVVSLYRTL